MGLKTEYEIKEVTIKQESYPKLLRLIKDPPEKLYYIGNLPNEKERIIAMVGARMCSAYGKSATFDIAKNISQFGASIISGMARGVDGIAHSGALHGNGRTYAVLAGGVDVIYPKENKELYYEIIRMGGGIISEQPPGQEPLKQMFPSRNRIISGLSTSVIIIEAREKSGSLLTANYALEQGKDIYALPGRITDNLSYGTNNLISDGAFCISSIERLLLDLKLKDDISKIGEYKQKLNLENEESLVYSFLSLTPKGVDELSVETGLSLTKVINVLTALVFKGFAEEYFMNRYIRRI